MWSMYQVNTFGIKKVDWSTTLTPPQADLKRVAISESDRAYSKHFHYKWIELRIGFVESATY